MDWAVDIIAPTNQDDLMLLRETLDAKRQAELGHHLEAARILWELAIGARHGGDRAFECITLIRMGKVYRRLRWAVAVKLYELAAELAESIRFDKARMMALNDLGQLRCSWGRLEGAVADLERSLDLVEAEDHQSRREVLLNLAVAHEGLGHNQECRTLLEEVIRLDRELKHPGLEDDREHLEEVISRLEEERQDQSRKKGASQ